MADWSLPALTSTYTNFLAEVKNRDVDLALQFDGTTSTNLTTGTVRWDSSANRWKKWTGAAWGELAATYALTGLSTTGAASIGTTLGVTGVATLSGGGTSTTPATDNNTTNIATTAFVVGQASATAPLMAGTATVGTSLRYARQDHRHATDTTRAPLASPTFTGTVTIPAGASISGYAPLASPTFTETPAAPTATAGTNTTQLATTAFVSSAISTSNSAVRPIANGGTGQTTAANAINALVPAQTGNSGRALTTNGSTVSWGTSGKLIQTVTFSTGAVATGTTTIPLDDTIPQITEGNEYMTLAITPTSASSLLCIQSTIALSSSGTLHIIAALFQGSTANALGTIARFINNGNLHTLNLTYWMTAGTTSATTFRIRAGGSAAGTTTFNGVSGARYFGGVCTSNLSIMEVTP
jgi:hypothetical protein